MNQNFIGILLIFVVISLTGCRKSARTHQERSSEMTEQTSVNENTRSTRGTRTKDNSSKITQKRSSKKLEGSEIFDKYGTAVFMIFTSDGQQGFQGSGFFIDNHGLAVSNYHVFKGTTIGMEQIKLLNDDTVYNVSEVIKKSSDEDFIIFRVNCDNTNYIPIATAKPKIGEKVYAIGSPRGLENTFSSGEVSQWRDTNLMQISALIDHGSSGGALINEYGEVIGITSGSFADGSQANLNYAWSIEAVKPYIND
jgi:serine protease Do